MDDYYSFFRDKCVVLVGPAGSIIGTKQGKVIDTYDIVVRINDALPIPKELYDDIGTRCDILYSNMNDKPTPYCQYRTIKNERVLQELQWVCTPIPLNFSQTKVDLGHNPHLSQEEYLRRQSQYCQKFQNRCPNIPFHIADSDSFVEFVNNMNGGRPNTGLATINDLLCSSLRSLYITGLTFFKGGYYHQYDNCPLTEKQIIEETPVGYETGLHQINPQKRYFKKLLKRDNRLNIDEALQNALLE